MKKKRILSEKVSMKMCLKHKENHKREKAKKEAALAKAATVPATATAAAAAEKCQSDCVSEEKWQGKVKGKCWENHFKINNGVDVVDIRNVKKEKQQICQGWEAAVAASTEAMSEQAERAEPKISTKCPLDSIQRVPQNYFLYTNYTCCSTKTPTTSKALLAEETIAVGRETKVTAVALATAPSTYNLCSQNDYGHKSNEKQRNIRKWNKSLDFQSIIDSMGSKTLSILLNRHYRISSSSNSSRSNSSSKSDTSYNHSDNSLSVFNAKYRRKCLIFICLILLHGCLINFVQASAPVTAPAIYNCTANGNRCQNGGECQQDGSCLCTDGWQGPECQSCGGKVRMYHSSGVIHDGFGNYSVSVKCSWLIDARRIIDHGPSRLLTKTPTIRMHLNEFATECGWDHLYIYDGDSVDSPLLAVFSGLMYQGNFSVRNVPQVIARSGTALLHFFSDDAYNMSGFNVTYKVNACPSTQEDLECSGHGRCLDNYCICDNLYSGDACDIAACPNDCSEALEQGFCDKHEKRCKCAADYGGNDCGQLKALGYWTSIPAKQLDYPPGTASHAATVWKDTLHIIGGETYGRGELMTTYDFNGNVWEAVHNEDNAIVPEKRYAMSTVMYGDKIYMYGGVVRGQGISNELWAFDVSARTWENITVKTEPCNTNATMYAMCAPLHVAGHSATLVPSYGDKHTFQYMLVIFGHSPHYGYLNTIQEYNFGTREWKILQTNGFIVKGGYGHTAAYDYLTEQVYVYGGIVSESESSQVLSSRLYSYKPTTRTWTVLTSSPSARLLHTANFINPGLMFVFGGNTHTDTTQSYGAKCYSQDVLVYDVFCDSWHMQSMPPYLQADLARFGHSASVFDDSLYVYGGFNGQLLNDILRYTPGKCSYFTKQEKCTSARPGIKCIWDVKQSSCVVINEIQKTALKWRDQDDYVVCPLKSRHQLTSEHLNNVVRCDEQNNCQSCLSNHFGCTYCGNGVCQKQKCRLPIPVYHFEPIPKHLDPEIKPMINVTAYDKCPNEDYLTAAVCEQLHNCHACNANPACNWEPEHNRCRQYISLPGQPFNRSIEDMTCPPPCAMISSCMNCTQEDCIWCQNEQRCVDRNAYTASFPYGQCREWTTYPTKCRSTTPVKSSWRTQSGYMDNATWPGLYTSPTKALNNYVAADVASCGFYSSCSQCLDDPACGWCDDGSNTGLGKCSAGGGGSPYDPLECPLKQWYFTSCPRCNCNGHSHCIDHRTCQQPCSNLTTGKHCETCDEGYWGNPINGGVCQTCKCNYQGKFCHPETGKCYCTTKGIIGDHCDKCDTQNHYIGDPLTTSCYYELTIDYQFTFNLSKKEDRHFTRINFRNSPSKPEIDADFTIQCSEPAKMDISFVRLGSSEISIFSNINCTTFRHRFLKTDYDFGVSKDNRSLTVFYVRVHDFEPPIWITIAFSQYPKLNLQQFFITFSTCFLLLLLIAAVLWKIKQKYDMYRRRQRLFVEMEQMASRPFSQVLVEMEPRDNIDLSQTMEGVTHLTKKRKKDCPSPIALEPCHGNRAAVLSLLVRLPTGGLPQAPAGQAAGLAVASALVTLGNPRRASTEQPKEPKAKRKQSQHPDNCT